MLGPNIDNLWNMDTGLGNNARDEVMSLVPSVENLEHSAAKPYFDDCSVSDKEFNPRRERCHTGDDVPACLFVHW